jgi:hypothetical protein
MNSLPGKKIGIRSLLVSIQFKLDQIVRDRPNIAVTYLPLDAREPGRVKECD